MKEYEDDFNILDLDLGWNDYDPKIFLRQPTFIHWYQWANGKLVREELNHAEICDRIHEGRMYLIDGVNLIVQELLEEENYELVSKVKEHCEKLHKDGLELEMRVERFL